MSELSGTVADYRAMSHEQRLDALADIEAQFARLQGKRSRLLAAVQADPLPNADGSDASEKEWAREEVAIVLKLSSGTARSMMLQAHELVTRFPDTLRLLDAGALTAPMARRLVEACAAISDELARKIEDRVLNRAGEQSLSQFSASLRRAVHALAPMQVEQQRQSARELRRVGFAHQPDGTSDLWACGLHAADAVAMQAALRNLARQWKQHNPDDERTSEQREADALVALVLGQPEAASGVTLKPNINVTVAAATLLGHDQQPGELDGYGSIPATVAVALATDPSGTWRRLLTDQNNRLVDLSTRTYRPPANMARLVRAQHPRCCFPGCRRRATYCELDHVLDRQYGGPTSAANLQPLCTRHHHLKHETGWKVQHQPDGTTTWTSPTGNTYTRPPDELPADTTPNYTDDDDETAA